VTALALIVVGALQVVFIIAMLGVLSVASRRGTRGDAFELAIAAKLRGPTRALMFGEDKGEKLAAELARLPRQVASRQLRSIVVSQLALEQRQLLAERIRQAGWVERTLAEGRSRFWWKRMEAARLLNVVMSEKDIPLLGSLVQDRNAAVRSAAAGAVAVYADAALIRNLIGGLSGSASTLRQQQMRALRSHSSTATEIVVENLATEKLPAQICALVLLAEVLGTPRALAATVPHAGHPDAEVRATVARALRSCFSPESVEAARVLLHDSDWRVRAAAARAIGSLKDEIAIPDLKRALSDASWWVRFRSALALGSFGEDGEEALATAAISADSFASDIAVVVGSLSESARIELSA
jgi:hypothetical protein